MAFAFRKSESVDFPSTAETKQPKVWSPARARRTKAYRKPDLAIPKKAVPETVKHEKESSA